MKEYLRPSAVGEIWEWRGHFLWERFEVLRIEPSFIEALLIDGNSPSTVGAKYRLNPRIYGGDWIRIDEFAEWVRECMQEGVEDAAGQTT